MKVAFLSFYRGQVYRGLETYVSEIASRLSKTNDVSIFQAGANVSHPTRELKEIVIPMEVNWDTPNLHLDGRADFDPGKRFYLNYWGLKIKEFTQKALSVIPTDTDVIIATNSGWQSLLSKIWATKNHRKLIIPGQSGPGWDDRINLLLHPNVFISLTSHQENWAKRNSFGTRVEKIPNGVDSERFNPKVKPAKTGLPGPLVLCVAALEKNKRIDLTIKAVAKTKASLLVLGVGDEKKALEDLAAKLLPGRFKIDAVKHDNIPSFYAACDVFTMAPTPAESFGIVYLEAMATNKPVVAPNDSARQEIVGRGGILTNVEDIGQYSQAIDNALTKKWGNEPLNQSRSFSWDTIAQKYEALLKTL